MGFLTVLMTIVALLNFVAMLACLYIDRVDLATLNAVVFFGLANMLNRHRRDQWNTKPTKR